MFSLNIFDKNHCKNPVRLEMLTMKQQTSWPVSMQAEQTSLEAELQDLQSQLAGAVVVGPFYTF